MVIKLVVDCCRLQKFFSMRTTRGLWEIQTGNHVEYLDSTSQIMS